jgi:1-acyl-sn-glycerol-3-phosphate acyltransferase
MEESWLSYAWYYGPVYWLSALILNLGFSFRCRGLRNVPRKGPTLLLANHQSYLDVLPLGVAVRRHPVYLARSGLFDNPFLRTLIRSCHGVPIDQDGFARDGLRTILNALKAGRAVVVFPEGERTHDGKLLPFKPGIHLLIKRLEATIVPIGLAGAFEAWPRNRLLPRPAPLFLPARERSIAVSIGEPIDSREYQGKSREAVIADLYQRIASEKEKAERLRRSPSANLP